PKNIAAFRLTGRWPKVRIGQATMPGGVDPAFRRQDGKWIEGRALNGKRPGLQGPIDDAFSSPFLCVRGTGRPWNEEVQKWAASNLARFADEWRVWFRGELPIKNDADVTAEDLRDRHLVLFGDPGSNRWISQALPKLPLTWTREELRMRGKTWSGADHVP